jgi:uncharacterized protein YkwD
VAPPSTGGAGSPSAPPTTTPTTPPQPAFDAAAAQQTALNEITAARKAQGNRPLTVDGTLTKAAAQHTADMVVNNYFSHTGSNGSSPTVRAIGLGYWGLSKEILARGNPGDDVVAALLKDPQSSYALLSGANSTIGVSAQQDPTSGQVIWTVELGYW